MAVVSDPTLRTTKLKVPETENSDDLKTVTCTALGDGKYGLDINGSGGGGGSQNANYIFNQFQSVLSNGSEINSGWIDFNNVDKYQLEALSDSPSLELFVESSNVNGGGEADRSSATFLETNFLILNQSPRQRYIRFRLVNNTGIDINNVNLAIKQTFGSSDKLTVKQLSENPDSSSLASINQSVQLGLQADGDFVKAKADGVAVNTTILLPGSGVFESAWIDTDGWSTIDVFVKSDVISASQGLIFEFTDDTNLQIIRETRSFSFTQFDIQNGSLSFRLPTILDGFRVRYINGPQVQSDFLLDITLRVYPDKGVFNQGNAQVTSKYLEEVALKKIPGQKNDVKFGRNPDLDSGTPEDIWALGGDYTGFNATQNENIEVFSSSGDDSGSVLSSGNASGGSSTTLIDDLATFIADGVTVGDLLINDTQHVHGIITNVTDTEITVFKMEDSGLADYINKPGDAYRIATATSTGAAVIKVSGILDDTFEEQNPIYVVLNGLTGVITTVNAYRSSRAFVVLAASNNGAIGNITIRQEISTSNVFNYIPIGFNQTLLSAYTVPKNSVVLIKNINLTISRVNGSAGSATISLKSRSFGGVFRSRQIYDLTVGGPIVEDLGGGLPFSEGTDIKFRADFISDNNTIASAYFEYLEIKN